MFRHWECKGVPHKPQGERQRPGEDILTGGEADGPQWVLAAEELPVDKGR